MGVSLRFCFGLLIGLHCSLAFRPAIRINRCHQNWAATGMPKHRFGTFLHSQTSQTEAEESATLIEFSETELSMVQDLYSIFKDAADDKDALQKVILGALPALPSDLLLKLRQSENHADTAVSKVSAQLNTILDARMALAKETLTGMLNAGEIRKLDALIGTASREGNLDVAFFNVLTMNLQDAMAEANNKKDGDADDAEASRVQILRHVFTRCQEEVEKTIPAGAALLNKLLRTEQAAIRANLYTHYLTPQANTITSPDGKEIELQGVKPVLVPLLDFVGAIDTAVLQIRNVEGAGGTDKESAAIMVESCRQVAKEARIIVGDTYGRDSEELRLFEEGLQPVFRPSSPDSPYIQGKQKT